MGGKGDIEVKLENFVNKSFNEFGLGDDGVMSRENCRQYFERLMTDKGKADAWADKNFDAIFDLFDEDDPAEAKEEGKKSGLDKSEFTKLVKRIAQL